MSEFILSLDVRLTRRWRDGRLRFRNLRQDVNHNVVEDLVDLWLPELTITGADDLVADLQQRKDVNFVDRQDSPVGDDDAELDEDHLYSGATNDLVAVREWTVETLCHYDLSDYPFDTQRCPLSFLLAKYTSDLFVVRIDRYGFSGNRRHHEYQLRHISVTNVTVGSYEGQGVILTLRNQYIYYISAAYVPSALLLVISYLTYYFSMEDFQTRINVALTSLLVLATLFSELVGGLPKTSYLKLIDIWFLGCIAADFCMVVCLVLIHKQTREEEQRGGRRLLLFGHPGSMGPFKGGVANTTRHVQPADGEFTSHRGATDAWGRGDPTVEPGSAQGPGGVREANASALSSRLNTLMRRLIPVAIAVLTISYSVSVLAILDT
ncbi:serotonin-gated chloride channel mod-1-like [Panulirus ornatus]|uniref:serotonin-gated chloride channel mod-1-like n=1 Tax=Panulirus ornatus TaxID=150431 RepID=UPI003A83C241